MKHELAVVHEADREWETWDQAQIATRGVTYWKTLISGDKTPSYSLTMGLAQIPPSETLSRHRHAQAEIYYILEGTGVVEIDDQKHIVGPGTAIFIPGDAIHCFTNTGISVLRFIYTFPADSFGDIEYIF
jgi:mannose-6-phosphate isomerase-like protein (cupin superfamily)